MRECDLVHHVRQEDHHGVDDRHVGVNGAVATGGLHVVAVADVAKNRNDQFYINLMNSLPRPSVGNLIINADGIHLQSVLLIRERADFSNPWLVTISDVFRIFNIEKCKLHIRCYWRFYLIME